MASRLKRESCNQTWPAFHDGWSDTISMCIVTPLEVTFISVVVAQSCMLHLI
jgi:hypothetical protein